MKYLATLMVALRGIFAHKLRSFLTVLGVIIGIGSIIAMMAVGEGSEKSILGDLADLGSDAMWYMGRTQWRTLSKRSAFSSRPKRC